MRLIDAIKVQTNCESDSELRNLSAEKKERLAALLEERISEAMPSIDEWNEVILCFADTEPETDNKTAKDKLLHILRGE